MERSIEFVLREQLKKASNLIKKFTILSERIKCLKCLHVQ